MNRSSSFFLSIKTLILSSIKKTFLVVELVGQTFDMSIARQSGQVLKNSHSKSMNNNVKKNCIVAKSHSCVVGAFQHEKVLFVFIDCKLQLEIQ